MQGIPCLARDDADPRGRRAEISAQMDAYQYTWHRPDGLATVWELPRDEGYSASLVAHYSVASGATEAAHLGAVTGFAARSAAGSWRAAADDGIVRRAMDSARAPLVDRETRRGTLDTCLAYFDGEVPDPVRRYVDDPARRDELFAWHRVGGADPYRIRRAREIPEVFAVTAGDVARALNGADSLDAARAEGRLYLCDWSELAGVATGETDGARKHVYAPWALFIEGRDGALRPVAIQVDARPDARRPAYTPADGAWWEFAKLAAQCADVNLQALQVHLGRGHLLQEALLLPTARCLPDRHPVKVLLRPSMRFTFAINRSVRDELMVPGTALETLLAPTLGHSLELVRAAVAGFDVAAAIPPASVAARDLGDLARCPWRDDATDLWRETRAFVAAWLAVFYPDDDAVAADAEVAAWAAEMASPWGSRLRVEAPKTRDALADLAAFIVYLAGPGHNVANYAEYDVYACAAITPAALYAPMPDAGGDIDGALARALMPEPQARAQHGFFRKQSVLHENSFGDFPPEVIADPRLGPVVTDFRRRLDALDAVFAARDAERLFAQRWLRPKALRGSIHT